VVDVDIERNSTPGSVGQLHPRLVGQIIDAESVAAGEVGYGDIDRTLVMEMDDVPRVVYRVPRAPTPDLE
jgi:hypothetical protein